MKRMNGMGRLVLLGLCWLGIGGGVWGEVVRVYSARHYESDDRLYALFEERTGIRVEAVHAGGDALLERIKAEGRNAAADVLITVDVARLWAAAEAGVFQPLETEALASNVPTEYRHPEGLWYGLTKRTRVLVYAEDRVKAEELTTYEDLVDPKWRDRILVRSSSNVYNQSLLGAMVAHLGEAAAQEWAAGIVRNLARRPQSNDTGQIEAVAAGLGDLALVNHYYFARLKHSEKAEERQKVEGLKLFFPNQDDRGAHVNISGAGVLRHARNAEAGLKFLEFLTTEEAQRLLIGGTGEFPVHPSLANDPRYQAFGTFKEDHLPAYRIGENTQTAVRLFDRVGWR